MATKIKCKNSKIEEGGCSVTIHAKDNNDQLVPTIVLGKKLKEKKLTDKISKDSDLTFNTIVSGKIKNQTIAQFMCDTNNFEES